MEASAREATGRGHGAPAPSPRPPAPEATSPKAPFPEATSPQAHAETTAPEGVVHADAAPWTLASVVRAADAVESEYDALKLLRALGRAHGFTHFLIAHVAGPSDRRLGDLVRLTNWPTELVAAYDAAGLLASSRVSSEIGTTALPVWWDLREHAAHGDNTDAQAALAMFLHHAMPCHLAFTVADGTGTRAAVSFSGALDRPDEAATGRLHAAAVYINERLRTVRPPPNAPTLTPRQRDVLEWTARGKTTPEIALILDISPHTVDHYAQAAMERLGAVNRTQAVAEAVRQRLI